MTLKKRLDISTRVKTRIGVAFFALLLFFSTFSALTSKVFADAYGYKIAQSRAIDEYEAIVALGLLKQCIAGVGLQGGFLGGTADLAKGKDYDDAGYFDDSFGPIDTRDDTVTPGYLFMGDDSSPKCSDKDFMGKIAKAMGFDSLRKLNETMFPYTSDCSGSGDRCDYAGNDKVFAAITKKMKDKKLAGPRGDDEALKLSKAAQYYYWYRLVYKSDYCDGKFVNTEGEYSPGPYNAYEKGKPYYWVDPSTGTVSQQKYAVFNNEEAGYLGVDFTKISDDYPDYFEGRGLGDLTSGGMSCSDIAAKLRDSSLAKAFADWSDELSQSCRSSDNASADKNCSTEQSIQDDPSTDAEFQCTVSKNPLTWFMCPLITGFKETIDKLDEQINNMLTIDTQSYFKSNNPENPATAFKGVWANVRTIAISFLVIIGLVMVISTAIGSSFVDAYTIKKVFPRLVVAVVLIAVSWPLVIFLIDASNSLGLGIRSLITAPFTQQFSTPIQLGGGQLSLGALGVVGLGFSLGVAGILSMVASALLAVLIAFLTLVFRQLLIILLAILAPIAIAAYILPNTQKLGKLWWDFFSKALLAFPIISAFIAIGRVFAIVSQQPGNELASTGTVRGFIAFVAYFGPYFALPQAFKMAGGALANLSGMVNDRGRGVFDRLKNFRKQQTQKNWQNTRSGNRFAGGTEANFRGRMNRRLEGASRLNEIGYDPRRWSSKMRNAMSDATEGHLEDAIKHSNFAVWSGDDEKLWAARGHTREEVERLLVQRDPGRFAGAANAAERDRAVEQIMTAKRQMGAEAFARARIRAQAKTGTGYQFEDENGNKYFDASAMLEDINEAYGDDRNGAGRALAEMRSSLANSGQVAGLAGYGTWASQMGAMYKAKTRRPGETDEQFEERYSRVRKTAHNRIMDDTINSVAPGQALYGKPTSAAAIGEAHARRIQAIANSINMGMPTIPTGRRDPVTGDQVMVDYGDGQGPVPEKRVATEDDLSAAVANAAGIYDAMAQASPNNANAMAEKLMGVELTTVQTREVPDVETTGPLKGQQKVDAAGNPVFRKVTQTRQGNIRQYITSQMGSNPQFVNRRRDFSAATWQQAQQAGAFNPNAGGGGAPGGLNPGPPPTVI